MVLTGIAAFERFAEELLAVAAAHRGYSLGQIAKLLDINNPTVKTLDDKLNSLLEWTAADRAWTACTCSTHYANPGESARRS
jgi:hypothetical protein